MCGIPGQGMFWEADECARCVRDVSGFFSPLDFDVGFWFGIYIVLRRHP